MKEYRTVYKEAQYELIEKKSRFLCSVKRVYSEEEALNFIRGISSAHRDATHNVYAYIIESETEIQRASDDGEPQGTAGVPVLDVIKKEGLVNVCAVVTRYFGGILLGAGGLIRAYSAAARGGLHEAKICNMALYNRVSIRIDYSLLGKIQNALSNLEDDIINAEYAQDVKLYVKVRYDRLDVTVKTVTDMTSGEAYIEKIDTIYDVSKIAG